MLFEEVIIQKIPKGAYLPQLWLFQFLFSLYFFYYVELIHLCRNRNESFLWQTLPAVICPLSVFSNSSLFPGWQDSRAAAQRQAAIPDASAWTSSSQNPIDKWTRSTSTGFYKGSRGCSSSQRCGSSRKQGPLKNRSSSPARVNTHGRLRHISTGLQRFPANCIVTRQHWATKSSVGIPRQTNKRTDEACYAIVCKVVHKIHAHLTTSLMRKPR